MNKKDQADRLYNLLPAIYRIRDADTQWQLQALLRVIAEQVSVVENDISQLYENWFIETCQDWVIPYIGDLVGYQQVHDAGEPGDVTTAEGRTRNNILIPRRDVANTIYYRRRRGTLAVLEQLARDVGGWPYAYAVEFHKYLGVTQNSNFLHSERGRLIDIRDSQALFAIGSPFGREAHTVDVHRAVSQHRQGHYNIPSVGLFIWRLNAYQVADTRAHKNEDAETQFTFSILGNDTQLYTNPIARQDSDGVPQPVDELNFPNPISLRAFEKRLNDYYGEGKSLAIWTIESSHKEYDREERHEHQIYHEHEERHKGERYERQHGHHDEWQKHHGQQKYYEHREHRRHLPYTDVKVEDHSAQQPPPQGRRRFIEASCIVPADLSDWHYRPRQGQVAVDTRLGRIAFPHKDAPERVYVSYYYAFSAEIGGGMYNRPILQPANTQVVIRVNKKRDTLPSSPSEPVYSSLQKALEAWQQWKKDHGQQPLQGVIEITDNDRYTLRMDIALEEKEQLYIRAANRTRPILHLIDKEEDEDENEEREEPTIRGEYGSRFTLDGLLVYGSPLRFEETIDAVHIRHCTLVPGRGIDSDCNPHYPDDPSMLIYQKGMCVSIEHSIVGSLLVEQDEVHREPLHINISDSILDATSEERNALSTSDNCFAHAVLNIARSTVLGQMLVHAISTAENSIFRGYITVARRQYGCMRFCSIVPGSRTPRRYNCQPDLAEQALDAHLKGVSQEQRNAARQLERDRVRPRFSSVHYGDPTYCQLAQTCVIEICCGADDESEMGVFHDLFQPQREANLRARLDDFTPAGMETGIIYV